MRSRTVQLFVFGVVLLLVAFAPVAFAAKPDKTNVCHLDKDTGTYSYISVPSKQFQPNPHGNLRGHARHVAAGDDILGLTREECLAKNPTPVPSPVAFTLTR